MAAQETPQAFRVAYRRVGLGRGVHVLNTGRRRHPALGLASRHEPALEMLQFGWDCATATQCGGGGKTGHGATEIGFCAYPGVRANNYS